MAKQRPSTQKRQREYDKRQREMKKAEKAELKRKRRENRDVHGDVFSPDGEPALSGVDADDPSQSG